MAATMALAMLGRADEALATLDALGADVARMGAQRWTPRPLNLRGWIVRNLGEIRGGRRAQPGRDRGGPTAGHGRAARQRAARPGVGTAAGRRARQAPRTLLDEADRLGDVEHAFRWRHQLRGRLLRARLELALEDDRGGTCRRRAPRRGCRERSASPATRSRPDWWRPWPRAGAGGAVDLDEVDRLLSRLGDVAGLEAWWITAGVARVFGVDALGGTGGRRVAALAKRAGPYATALERSAARGSR